MNRPLPSQRSDDAFRRQDEPGGPITTHLPGRRLALLFVVSMVSTTGNSAMLSVMPSIGTQLRIPDVVISLAFTFSALLWAIFAPYWARRSDQRGRKAMMTLGLAAFTAHFFIGGAMLWLGLSGWIGGWLALALFAAVRLINGALGSATPSAVQAYVASRTGPEDRTRALSLIASSMGLGTVIGPGLAPLLILPFVGLIGPFLAFGLFGLATIIALRLYLPHDRPAFPAHGGVTSPSGEETFETGPWSEPDAASGAPRLRWGDPRVRGWIVSAAIGGTAQVALSAITGFLVLDRLGLRADPHGGAGPIGLVMMSGAFATLLAQWGLIPMLRPSPKTSVLAGMALAAVGMALWGMGQNLHAIALGYAIASLGFGLHRPGFTAGMSLAVSQAEQSQVAGIVSSMLGAIYVLSVLAVWLYGHEPVLIFTILPALCIIAAISVQRLTPAS